MSTDPLVSRPHYDTRPAAHGASVQYTPSLEAPQPSSGSVTAGFRSAKYTPGEWYINYHNILQQAGNHRLEGRSVQLESKGLNQETDEATLNSQNDGRRLLGERLQEVHSWKSEVQWHIDRLRGDTEALVGIRTRLEKSLEATEISYAIATDNLNCRTRRQLPDVVKDMVEIELLKEVDLIRSVQDLLRRTIAQVRSQIKTNRETKQMLETDWSDKHQAYCLDDHSGRLTNMSPDTKLHPSSTKMQGHASTPMSWTKFSQDSLSKAMQDEQASTSLRRLVEQLLKDTTEDLTFQCATVNRAFSQRFIELCEAKAQLEIRLAEILELIGAQEKNIADLQHAIHNKEPPLRVLHTRLYLRSLRPYVELCRDAAQISLEGEEKQLEAFVAALRRQLIEAECSLTNLQDSRMALEKDINCKTLSMFIDRDKCVSQRKRYPTVSVLSGY